MLKTSLLIGRKGLHMCEKTISLAVIEAIRIFKVGFHMKKTVSKSQYVYKYYSSVTRLFLFADWPEKHFSGQSEAGNSNFPGTGSVRLSAQAGAVPDCVVNFHHHERSIVQANYPWVFEDV